MIMNQRTTLFASVLLNVVLLAAALVALRAYAPKTASAPEVKAGGELVQKVTRTRQINEPDHVISLDWKAIESGDYQKYIANLRAIGAPEETVRDIVIADINKLYARKWRELNPTRPYKYWRYGRSSSDDPVRETNERRKQRDALLREKRQLVRDLVGVDLAEDGERYADPSFRGSSADMQQYDFLSVEKRQMFREIQDRYQQQFQQIQDNLDPDGYISPETRKQMAALRRQAEAEMMAALTPEEQEQFQLRFSNTAQTLRNTLAGFDPTEEEFRRIFALRQPVDQQFEDMDGNDAQARQRRTEAYAQLDQTIRNTLSPERLAAYAKSQDRAYRDTLSFASAWDLPQETASAVYAIRQSAEQKMQQLSSAAADQRQTGLAGLRAEVEQSLRTTLGEKAYASYIRNQSWLRQLGQ